MSSGYPPPPSPDEPAPGGRGRLLVGLAVVVVLLAVGVAVLVLVLGDDDESGGDDPGSASVTAPDDDDSEDDEDDPPAADPVAGEDDLSDPYAPDSGATGYDVGHYDVAFSYDPDSGAVDGTTTLTATADEALSRFSVDLLALEVSTVVVDGEEAEVEVDGRDVRITPAAPIGAGDGFEVEVSYQGVPEPVISAGFETGWLTTGEGGAFVIGQPDGAATWFPSNDHPSDKATIDLAVTVPAGWEVAANGELRGEEAEGDEVTWSWSEDDPIATYLVTVAIDQFVVVEEETADGLPLVSFYPEDDAERLEADFADHEDMIAAFEDLFGPYPFDEYGAIVVPTSLGLALETQTRSIFGIDVASIEEFRAHELAHQWFGDSLTPERWEDIWLNEGFATYGELLWAEASQPGYDIDEDARERREYLVGVDQGHIRDPGPDRMFSEAVYQRGGLVLHALRRTVGDDDFFAILQQWAADFEHATVTTEDFTALAEDVSGEDLEDFFADWLDADRIPELPT